MDILLLIVAGTLSVCGWAYSMFRMKDFNKVLIMSLIGTVSLLSLAFLSLLMMPEPGMPTGTKHLPVLFTFFSVLTLVFKLIFIAFVIQWHFASMREIRAMKDLAIQHREECLRIMELMNQSSAESRQQFLASLHRNE